MPASDPWWWTTRRPCQGNPATRNAHSPQPLAVVDFGICLGFWVDAKHLQGSPQPRAEKNSTMAPFSGLFSGSTVWWSYLLTRLAEAFSELPFRLRLFLSNSPSLPSTFTGVRPTAWAEGFPWQLLFLFHFIVNRNYCQLKSCTSCSVLASAFGETLLTHIITLHFVIAGTSQRRYGKKIIKPAFIISHLFIVFPHNNFCCL